MVETGVLLTAADYAALDLELESLRSRYRIELAERLRLARGFGGAVENDDLLAVLEDAAIAEARIAQLEELMRCASVIDAGMSSDGGAGLGSIVRVTDDGGQTTEYELVGRRSPESSRHEVSPASPIGKALLGTRPGDVVRVGLPSGRDRRLQVLEVSGSVQEAPPASLADAEAA